MTMWLAGRYNWDDEKRAYDELWLVQGIFDTEDGARAACRDQTYFVMPLRLNESLPHEPQESAGAYYPLAEGASV